jgi:CRISPR-associated protein Cas5d
MSNNDALSLLVWGDLACFTRPEMKVERVTYPVMTPSAARGVLEAVFWKPEFTWQVEEIHVLRPIRYFSILRNEANSRASVARALSPEGYDATEDRAQRHTLALRDVAYVIHARQRLRPHATDPPAKYREQFVRRLEKGQCFATPFLGCREFSGSFSVSTGHEQPIDRTEDLGPMLLDLDFEPGTGRGQPHFFNARLDHGVLRVPAPPWAKEV